jgi:hypothetical protein
LWKYDVKNNKNVSNESYQVVNVGELYTYIKVGEHEEAAKLPPFVVVQVASVERN